MPPPLWVISDKRAFSTANLRKIDPFANFSQYYCRSFLLCFFRTVPQQFMSGQDDKALYKLISFCILSTLSVVKVIVCAVITANSSGRHCHWIRTSVYRELRSVFKFAWPMSSHCLFSCGWSWQVSKLSSPESPENNSFYFSQKT